MFIYVYAAAVLVPEDVRLEVASSPVAPQVYNVCTQFTCFTSAKGWTYADVAYADVC